ncbi:hypothetical protein ABPG74_002489 [Tetrahymena malaccensis]
MNYSRQREQQFDYDRTLSQLQVNQQARQLKKRCELQQYESFGFNLQSAQQNLQQYSQTSDHIVLVMENTHVLIIKAKLIQENYAENLQLNCKFVGQQLQVEYTLLNEIICEQCFKKKGMYICQESQNPRFIYCVLYGSVLYQDESPSGTSRNRVFLGEGAIIGQSIKDEKQSNNSIKIQSQIAQKAISRQNTRYNGIQLDIQTNDKNNEKDNQISSSIHSSSDFTVVLMIDKEKLGQKLTEYRKQQEYSVNNNNNNSNKQYYSQSQQWSISNHKTDNSQINDYNSQIQQSRRQQRPLQDINNIKGRLVFQKKNRSQSYSILCKLIQKEERSNSYSRNKQNFIELNPNYKKEYLAIEQPQNKTKIQTQIEQSFYQSNATAYNSTENKNQEFQANEDNSNRNDFEDVVKRLAEKSVFPQYYQQEKKYNKILMKNMKDREQIARLIIESKKPTYLPNYFSNPENYVNKDQLMNQFHTKYLHHSIKELQNNHKQKRSYTHQTQSQNSNDYLENFNINSLQTEEEIDKFIQKINRQLIMSEIQQNQTPNKTSPNITNNNNNQQIYIKQNTLGNLISEQNVDLDHDEDKLNHLTANSQQLFYPYRVQEMLDQFISLKNQESGQNNLECIEIRKSSIPQIKSQGQQERFQQEEAFRNQDQLIQNDFNQMYQDIAFESNQDLQEIDVKYPSNDSFQNDQYVSQLEMQEQNQNQNIDTTQSQIQNYEIMNYFTSNQVSRLGSKGNLVAVNQQNFNANSEKGVLRSQSVHNILRKQQDVQQQKVFALNQMYPNIRQRSLSKNKIQYKNNQNFTKSQNEAINKILTKTEFRLKRQSEKQLNKMVSEECRSSTIFKPEKNVVSLLSTYIHNTQQNSQKTSRRSSNLKARPSTSNLSSNQFNLTSKQIMLSQFNNNLNSSLSNLQKQNLKQSQSEINKAPNRTILFSSSDRRYSKLNLPQHKVNYQQQENQDYQQVLKQ